VHLAAANAGSFNDVAFMVRKKRNVFVTCRLMLLLQADMM